MKASFEIAFVLHYYFHFIKKDTQKPRMDLLHKHIII